MTKAELLAPLREITTSDLNRANAGNQDNKEGDTSRIHWGKFALMGRLVNNVTMFQNRCRTSPALHVQDRHGLYQQLFPQSLVLMDDDVRTYYSFLRLRKLTFRR